MKKQEGLDWLDRSLLTSPYHYALCLSEAAFTRELTRLKISEKNQGDWIKTPHARATLHFFDNANDVELCAIICLREDKKSSREQIYALLTHEAVHLWQAVKERIGEHTPGDECEAYAIQRISQSLMYSYKEQTTKKRKKF